MVEVSAEIMQFMQFLSQPRHDSNSKPRYKEYASRLAAAGYSQVRQLACAEAEDLTRRPQPGVTLADTRVIINEAKQQLAGAGSPAGSKKGSPPGTIRSTQTLSDKNFVLREAFPNIKADFQPGGTLGSFRGSPALLSEFDSDIIDPVALRVTAATYRFTRLLFPVGKEAEEVLIWGTVLAAIAELASLTAPATAGAGAAARASVSQLPAGEAAGGVAVQHPAAGSPGEADGPLLTVKPLTTIAHEESIYVPTIVSGSVELQVKMLNAEAKEYTAGAVEVGLGLDSKARFEHKRNQAENELFAFTCLNATQGIFERTFVILTDGLDMMCLTYQDNNKPGCSGVAYQPGTKVKTRDISGTIRASSSYKMFDSEHRAGRDVRNAVALFLDCMWPQAKTTTVDELTAKLKQLDAEVEAEAANEGYYLQGAKKRRTAP